MAVQPAKVVKKRPAESGGVAGAVAGLVVWSFGIDDPRVFLSLTILVGFAPAAITWLVTLIRG